MAAPQETAPLLHSRVTQLARTPDHGDPEPAVSGPRVARRGSIRFSVRSSATFTEPEGPDGGWGWVVVAASFICLCVLDGAAYTFGVFLDPLIEEMGGGRGQTSLAGSLLVATYAFTGPLASRLVTRFGTRKVAMAGAVIAAAGLGLGSVTRSLLGLIVTYSVITGVGFGLMYIPSIVAVANHFTRQRSLAIGICLCGAGVGTFALSPLETFITQHYGWRWGLLSLALLSLGCCVCGATMTRVSRQPWLPAQPQPAPEPRPAEEPRSCCGRVLGLVLEPGLYTSPAFPLYALVVAADLAATLALFIPFQHLPAVAHSRGVDRTQAAYIISATGMCSTLGRLVAGWLCDRSWLHPLSLSSLAITAVTVPLFCLAVCNSFFTFVLCASLFGLLTGCWVAAMSPIFIRILGPDLLNSAFGLVTAVRGVASLVGPPIAGFAVDYFESREAAIVLSGLSMAASAATFIAATLYSAWRDIQALNMDTGLLPE